MASRIDYAALLELRSAGLPASQIAARLGFSTASVHAAAKKFGLERRSSGKTPTLCAAELQRLWVKGVSLQEIADQSGVSLKYIYSYAIKMKFPKRPKAERKRTTVDPSPEEIERLKAELREKHFAERRNEKDETARIKIWRHRKELTA